MSIEEKKEVLADILEVDIEEIVEDRELSTYEAWDSIAVLGVISVINEKAGKFPHADDIKKLKTIGDVLKALDE
ncbi:MAG: acyl carrier protein [Lachnospiraceae bacterium]|nr:acyl carrier protein [Lachnospiraceae bacterium]